VDILQRYRSPALDLVWLANRAAEANGRTVIAMGFEGFLWHLHPDEFELRGRSDEAFCADVTAALLNDELVVFTEQDGEFVRHTLLDDLDLELEIKRKESVWRFRYWSGRTVSFDDLVDGGARYVPISQV